MRTTNAEHWLSLQHEYDHNLGKEVPIVRGVSSWNIPDGHSRLVREMRRSTKLRNPKEVARWAKRFSDISEQQLTEAINHFNQ